MGLSNLIIGWIWRKWSISIGGSNLNNVEGYVESIRAVFVTEYLLYPYTIYITQNCKTSIRIIRSIGGGGGHESF